MVFSLLVVSAGLLVVDGIVSADAGAAVSNAD